MKRSTMLVLLASLPAAMSPATAGVTKDELVEHVAAVSGATPETATLAVDALLDRIRQALADGETVSIVGFGSFSVLTRKARTGRNPRTGDEITIPESRLPRFTPARALKEAVN